MQLAFDLFGSDAFRRPPRHGGSRRAPINKPLFESWAVNLARIHRLEGRERLVQRRQQVKDRFAALMDDDEFEQSISIGTQWFTRVKIRFARIRDLLQEVLT